MGDLQAIFQAVDALTDDEKETLLHYLQQQTHHTPDQMAIFNIKPLYLDPGHSALTLLSREDMYGDDGR